MPLVVFKHGLLPFLVGEVSPSVTRCANCFSRRIISYHPGSQSIPTILHYALCLSVFPVLWVPRLVRVHAEVLEHTLHGSVYPGVYPEDHRFRAPGTIHYPDPSLYTKHIHALAILVVKINKSGQFLGQFIMKVYI